MPQKDVLLLIETSDNYGRGLLQGIGSYALANGRWALYFEQRGMEERQPSWLRSWRGDGIIFRGNDRAVVRAIQKAGVPAIDTHCEITDHGFPLVYVDEAAVAQLAVEHFVERQFQHFAFCTVLERTWVQWRREAFRQALADRGLVVHEFSTGKRELQWDEQCRALAQWAQGLPKPIAVLTAEDVCGLRLINACRTVGIRIPEEVAVLGVDNDELTCGVTWLPLSSIDLNTRGIGQAAAALLDRTMRGLRPAAGPVWVPPSGVVTRQSTDILALDDADMVQALSFIRQHACNGLSVGDVVAHLAISRATLERKFARFLGRGPKEEILRIRLEQVKRLLRETDRTIAEICTLTGFTNDTHLSTAFKRQFGQTCGQYRLGR